jgi:NAD(P)H-nitrite reductase large subunit
VEEASGPPTVEAVDIMTVNMKMHSWKRLRKCLGRASGLGSMIELAIATSTSKALTSELATPAVEEERVVCMCFGVQEGTLMCAVAGRRGALAIA